MKVSNMDLPTEKPVMIDCGYDFLLKDGIRCRDPFILLYGDKYFLYKRAYDKIVVLVSEDLERWSDEITVYRPSENFHGIKDLFWAPECHYYNGNFYLFTSVFSDKTQHRCISVYRADNPLGPFEDIADGRITPKEWDAIDGTLYVDDNGQPWMVFVHEWVCTPDKNGSFVAAKLSSDFTHFISEPVHLFYANEMSGATMGVTDGCYLIKLESGRLMMIWSNFTEKGYVIAKAYSVSGKIMGPWKQDGLLYEKGCDGSALYDGGHGMVFRKKDGKFAITFHTPNTPNKETAEIVCIRDIVETETTIKLS